MSSIINSKHLKLFKLIKFTDGKNLKAIKLFLNLSTQNISNYLKDLNSVVTNNQKYMDKDSAINQILSTNNNLEPLKKYQFITKDERIFFLTLSLLTDSFLDLDKLSKILEVSRRSLNTDLDSVKKSINQFDLTISSIPGKGIFLTGEDTSRKRALFAFTYKLLIEKDYLPKIFLDTFPYLLADTDNPKLHDEIEKLLEICSFENYFRGQELFKSFYFSSSFLDRKNSKEKTFGSELKNFSTFSLYFTKPFTKELLTKLHNFLLTSTFKDIDFSNIIIFARTFDVGIANFEYSSEIFSSNVIFWEKYVSNFLDIPITEKNSVEFKKIISKIIFFSSNRYFVPLNDFLFFDLNLNKNFIDKSFDLYFNLKRHHWNVSFSDIIAIFFSLNYFEREKKEVVIVFKDMPKHLILNMKESLEFKYDIKIKDIVSYYEFEKYKKNNSVKTVGTFTELNFNDKDLNILNLVINF